MRRLCFCLIALPLLACAPLIEDETPEVPEFGFGAPEVRTVAQSSSGLDVPRDLDFHPVRDELWTVNRGFEGSVIYTELSTPNQEALRRADAFSNHFMAEVSAMAMGADDTFATCQESRNTYGGQTPPNDFMGPTLWPADLDIYAQVNQNLFGALGGSHLDMLHQSPNCMGIEHDSDNAFWVFDGENGHIVYYDFQVPHVYGGDDHSDGIVRRYDEVDVERVPDVPSHMALDHETGVLYIADTGTGRIIAMDTTSGEEAGNLFAFNEPLEEFTRYEGVDHWTVVPRGGTLEQPSGLALVDGRLFVTDHANGQIVAFSTQGEELGRIDTGADKIMGITVDADGRLCFVDAGSDKLLRIVPELDPLEM